MRPHNPKFRRTCSWFGFATILFISACETYNVADERVEAANLEQAIYCVELLELYHDFETAGQECFGDTYIQHTPWLPDGKEAVLRLMARRLKDNPDKSISIKRAGADGDLVWVHLHSFGSVANPGGNAVINIFRMKKGRFVEHWNVVQRVPEAAKNENSVF